MIEYYSYNGGYRLRENDQPVQGVTNAEFHGIEHLYEDQRTGILYGHEGTCNLNNEAAFLFVKNELRYIVPNPELAEFDHIHRNHAVHTYGFGFSIGGADLTYRGTPNTCTQQEINSLNHFFDQIREGYFARRRLGQQVQAFDISPETFELIRRFVQGSRDLGNGNINNLTVRYKGYQIRPHNNLYGFDIFFHPA